MIFEVAWSSRVAGVADAFVRVVFRRRLRRRQIERSGNRRISLYLAHCSARSSAQFALNASRISIEFFEPWLRPALSIADEDPARRSRFIARTAFSCPRRVSKEDVTAGDPSHR